MLRGKRVYPTEMQLERAATLACDGAREDQGILRVRLSLWSTARHFGRICGSLVDALALIRVECFPSRRWRQMRRMNPLQSGVVSARWWSSSSAPLGHVASIHVASGDPSLDGGLTPPEGALARLLTAHPYGSGPSARPILRAHCQNSTCNRGTRV